MQQRHTPLDLVLAREENQNMTHRLLTVDLYVCIHTYIKKSGKEKLTFEEQQKCSRRLVCLYLGGLLGLGY